MTAFLLKITKLGLAGKVKVNKTKFKSFKNIIMNIQIPIKQIDHVTSKFALRVDIQSADGEKNRGEWLGSSYELVMEVET